MPCAATQHEEGLAWRSERDVRVVEGTRPRVGRLRLGILGAGRGALRDIAGAFASVSAQAGGSHRSSAGSRLSRTISFAPFCSRPANERATGLGGEPSRAGLGERAHRPHGPICVFDAISQYRRYELALLPASFLQTKCERYRNLAHPGRAAHTAVNNTICKINNHRLM